MPEDQKNGLTSRNRIAQSTTQNNAGNGQKYLYVYEEEESFFDNYEYEARQNENNNLTKENE